MEPLTRKIITELNEQASPAKAAILSRFFKTGPGEYGEGDRFIGIPVPLARETAKRHRDADYATLGELLSSPVHEARLTAVLILVLRFEKAKDTATRDECARFYIAHLDALNNCDLVDLSCYKILGPWLADRSLLYDERNLQALCHECHSRKTATEDGGFGRKVAGMGAEKK